MADFNISTNISLKKKAEWDERKYKATFAEILTFTEDDYIPYGFTVTCAGDDDVTKRGIWMCIDENALSNPSSWEKQGGGGEVETDATPISGSTNPIQSNAVYQVKQTADSALAAAQVAQEDIDALEIVVSGKQAALGFTPENSTNKSTDGTLSSNSDSKYPSEKAVKTYVDNHTVTVADASETVKGIAELADQTESEAAANASVATNADHTRAVTLRGLFWFWGKIKTLAQTVSGLWSFTNGVEVNMATNPFVDLKSGANTWKVQHTTSGNLFNIFYNGANRFAISNQGAAAINGVSGNGWMSLPASTATIGHIYYAPGQAYTGTVNGEDWYESTNTRRRFMKGTIATDYQFTYDNLALKGINNRILMVNQYGDVFAVDASEEGFTFDADVQAAITGATYDTNGEATISPANGKKFNQGQWYSNGNKLYFGIKENRVTCLTKGNTVSQLTQSFLFDAAQYGSLAAGDTLGITFSMNGVQVDQTVAIGLPSSPIIGLAYTPFVSATNVVCLRVTNCTNSAITLSDFTVKFSVIQ